MPDAPAGRNLDCTGIAELAARLIRDYEGDAALIAWGQADTEADHGHVQLSRKWIRVMERIVALHPSPTPRGS